MKNSSDFNSVFGQNTLAGITSLIDNSPLAKLSHSQKKQLANLKSIILANNLASLPKITYQSNLANILGFGKNSITDIANRSAIGTFDRSILSNPFAESSPSYKKLENLGLIDNGTIATNFYKVFEEHRKYHSVFEANRKYRSAFEEFRSATSINRRNIVASLSSIGLSDMLPKEKNARAIKPFIDRTPPTTVNITINVIIQNGNEKELIKTTSKSFQRP